MSNMQVPNTILEQLGGSRFRIMTGAKDFIGKSNDDGTGYLRFRLGMVRKIMQITLNAEDLYDITLQTYKGRPVDERKGIYVDNLQTTFTKMTGLDTHL